MAGSKGKILCGSCKVALVGPADAKDGGVFSCSKCGRSDTLKNVLVEVGKHTKELTARHVQETLRKSFGGSKNFKLQGQTIPRHTYRFISDLKL